MGEVEEEIEPCFMPSQKKYIPRKSHRSHRQKTESIPVGNNCFSQKQVVIAGKLLTTFALLSHCEPFAGIFQEAGLA